MHLFDIVLITIISLYSNSGQEIRSLFNGKNLDGWEVIQFEGYGNISIADSSIIIEKGKEISGIRWTGDFSKTNYEVTFDARRIEGSDFFCGITFPVKESFLTLVTGGWGGSMVGLSCIDGFDAANNFTGNSFNFESGKWYTIRFKVTDKKIEAWIDDEKIIDFAIKDHYLSLRWESESSKPFGICTYKTTGALRNITVKKITE